MESTATTKDEHIILQVDGMTCGSCVRAVETALSAVQGVERAVVDLTTGRAHIEGEVQRQELIRAVEDAGYEARPKDDLAPATSASKSGCC